MAAFLLKKIKLQIVYLLFIEIVSRYTMCIMRTLRQLL